MVKRFCGMCGAPAKPVAQIRIISENKISETRWCPDCGSLGVRELFLDSEKPLLEIWQEPTNKGS